MKQNMSILNEANTVRYVQATTRPSFDPSTIQKQDIVKDEEFDLTAYMRSMTHVSLIQDNELVRYDPCGGQPSYGPGIIPTSPPQSFVDDLEDW